MERERVTIQEAARRLGVSESAIRKRVQRGTLQHHKEQDGRVYVYLDKGETVEDKVRDASRDELVDELRDRVHRLEQDLDTRTEELREHRRIIAALTQRIPEIEAPRDSTPEPRGGPENGAEPRGGPENGAEPRPGTEAPASDAGEPRPGTEAPASDAGEPRPSWWRRFFGFE